MFSHIRSLIFLLVLFVAITAIPATAKTPPVPRTQAAEIRHQILMSPYYGVFDWIEAEVRPGRRVVLHGQVREPYAKSDAESRIRKVEGVAVVVNEIEVLPVSQIDDNIRVAMYRAIFRYNGPLFRYANSVNPSIHIIVNNGRVTLKGIVGDRMDRQLAFIAARNVPGVFEVRNELTIDRA